MKLLLKKVVYKNRASSETYINYLRKKGMSIGENTTIFAPRNVTIDETRPWLIEIGNNVNITENVTILTHGYDLAVIMNKYGDLYGSSGKVKIGNNVFIGIKSTILKGVTIGDNVIIGANSLVNKDIPNDVVVAGNPARIIMTLDEYKEKRKKEYINEAKELIREYKKAYGVNPSHNELREFFPIYLNRNDIENASDFFMSFKKVREKFINSKPIYNGLEEFLEDAFKNCDD
ncbi:MAG: DapH/DapD/GlmU-related protein [Clostridium sp.]